MVSTKKPKKPWVHHCTGCGRADRSPVQTDYFVESPRSCCTCCRDGDGNQGPGRNDGGGW